MKLLKKIFFGIIIASAIFAIAYVLPNIYNIGFDPIKIYETYTTYVFFLYISIILIYICATSYSHLSTIIITILVLVNFFRLVSFFTQEILGISIREFYALTILFLLALATIYIRNRIRYPLIVLIGIPFIIILLNHALPLYSNKPDFQGFYDSQVTTLNIQTADDEKTLQEAGTKITIESPIKKTTFELRQTPSEQTDLSSEFFSSNHLTSSGESSVIIQFSSKTGVQNTYAYITFPQGTIITLYPQSAVEVIPTTLEKGGSRSGGDLPIFLDIIQGKVGIYTPLDQSGYLILTGDLTNILLNDTGNIQNFIDGFMAQRNTYFINQIGGEIMLNPTIDSFIGRYIDLANSAYSIIGNILNHFPKSITSSDIVGTYLQTSYSQNKLNYDEFHTYLDYGTHTAYEAATGSTQRVERNTQKGRDSTNIKARRDNIQTTVNGRFGKQ